MISDLNRALESITDALAYVRRAQDLTHGHTYALCDAYDLLLDAASQIRGQQRDDRPEYPLYMKEAV